MGNSAFIFDDVCIAPDKQIGLHTHARYELSYVVCGAGMRTIGNHTEPFTSGEIIFIPPNIPHYWKFDPDITNMDGRIANISIFFDSSLISSMKLLFPEMTDTLTRIELLKEAINYRGKAYRTIQNLIARMRSLTSEKRFPKMMELLIAIADTSGSTHAGENNILSKREKRLEQIRVYCACNYSRQIKLNEISLHVGMNKSAFCTFMRHNTGMTFSEFVNSMRLDKAEEKLFNTDYNIAEIAMACGFRNATYFNRLFRKKYGCTPKEIREKKRTEIPAPIHTD